MARGSRYALDPDAHSATSPSIKMGSQTSAEAFTARSSAREDLRDLDGMIQDSPGFNQSHKDAQSAYPRETNAPLRPRTERPLPHADETRVPISARQRRERSKAKSAALHRTPRSERREVAALLTQNGRWQSVNDELSTVVGDIHHDDVRPETKRACRRADQMIQRYERENDRSHVVYTNVMLPSISSAGLTVTAARDFPSGRIVEFDRYTAGAHTMHEVEPAERAEEERSVVFEIATRRGMYMGQSAGGTSTGHLLPRATRYEVVGSHAATYVSPDGTLAERTVVQLRDYTEDNDQKG